MALIGRRDGKWLKSPDGKLSRGCSCCCKYACCCGGIATCFNLTKEECEQAGCTSYDTPSLKQVCCTNPGCDGFEDPPGSPCKWCTVPTGNCGCCPGGGVVTLPDTVTLSLPSFSVSAAGLIALCPPGDTFGPFNVCSRACCEFHQGLCAAAAAAGLVSSVTLVRTAGCTYSGGTVPGDGGSIGNPPCSATCWCNTTWQWVSYTYQPCQGGPLGGFLEIWSNIALNGCPSCRELRLLRVDFPDTCSFDDITFDDDDLGAGVSLVPGQPHVIGVDI